jgi:hypothetical protein
MSVAGALASGVMFPAAVVAVVVILVLVAVVEGSYGQRVEIQPHVGFDFTVPYPYFTLPHLFVT